MREDAMLPGAPTIQDLVGKSASLRPDAIVLRFEDRATSYAALERRTNRIANALLAEGLRPGDRVAHLGKNSDRYFELLLGAAKAGLILVPLNWRLAPAELGDIVRDAEPAILFVGPEFADLVAGLSAGSTIRRGVSIDAQSGGLPSFADWFADAGELPPPAKSRTDDVVLLMYTSGTTGRPKGVMLTHRSLLRLDGDQPHRDPEWFRWEPGEVALIAMPTFHIGGTGQGLRALRGGSTALILREFSVDGVLAAVAAFGVTKLFLVPTALHAVLRHPSIGKADYSSLRYILYGASPIAMELLEEAIAVFGCDCVQMYGSTETSGTITALSPEDHRAGDRALLLTAGRPLPGVEIRIIDEAGRTLPVDTPGEVAIRSVANMVGYWRLPDETARTIDAEGWLRTGDAGSLDAKGYLRVHDRVKDMIISGGENVYPAEVENAIYGHPSVSEVAVVGVAHPRWGEAVTAVVVPKPGAARDGQGIIAWARSRIAGYKVPKSVHFVESLPRNPSGKILRRKLREDLAARH
jgi:long-chain acyl-CoA synthetase